jgi:hypothetical protein
VVGCSAAAAAISCGLGGNAYRIEQQLMFVVQQTSDEQILQSVVSCMTLPSSRNGVCRGMFVKNDHSSTAT